MVAKVGGRRHAEQKRCEAAAQQPRKRMVTSEVVQTSGVQRARRPHAKTALEKMIPAQNTKVWQPMEKASRAA